MGWLATKYEFYSFIMFHQNCFQIQSQEHRFSKFSWGYAPRPLAKHTEQDAESGLHIMWARPTLSNAHFKFWCYIIFIIMCIWKTQLSWNLSQPLTLFYFWISTWSASIWKGSSTLKLISIFRHGFHAYNIMVSGDSSPTVKEERCS